MNYFIFVLLIFDSVQEIRREMRRLQMRRHYLMKRKMKRMKI